MSYIFFLLSFRIVCVTGPAVLPLQKGRVRVIVGKKHSGVSSREFLYVVSMKLDAIINHTVAAFKEEGYLAQPNTEKDGQT